MSHPALGWFFHLAGGVVVVWIYRRWQRARGFTTEGMRLVFLAAVVGGLVGAEILQSLSDAWGRGLSSGAGREPLLHLVLGGKTWIGALIGGYAAVELVKRPLGIRRSTGDGFALALPLGEAVGRLGCFFAPCCWGTGSLLPWAVWQAGAWRHPTQLYSALGALLIFAVLYPLRERMPREGDLFKLYLLLYAVERFGLEFVRDRPPGPLGLSPAQGLCLAAIPILTAALLRHLKGP